MFTFDCIREYVLILSILFITAIYLVSFFSFYSEVYAVFNLAQSFGFKMYWAYTVT